MSSKAIVSRPKKCSEPSARDQEIYRQHTVYQVLQKDLATRYEMHFSRVSQIVKKVAAWWADASPREGELDHGQRLRLERRLERERLEMLYGESLKLLREWEEESQVEDRKSKVEGAGELNIANCKLQIAKCQLPICNLQSAGASGADAASPGEAPSPQPSPSGRGGTRDHASQRVQALKCAIRTTESLGKLAEREPAPEPAGAKDFIHWGRLNAQLGRERELAEESGAAPVSGDSHDLVACVLRAMLGKPPYRIEPGPPSRRLWPRSAPRWCGWEASGRRSRMRRRTGQETRPTTIKMPALRWLKVAGSRCWRAVRRM